ncbi:MAG TPA: hypothetical protein VEH29_18220 [Acidimicrobiales bacterium]|nr:hypothetical protein [Acidimicrobiales bacterium]
MTIGLDLSSSTAKVDRAFVHLKTLHTELLVHIKKNSPYSIQFSEVNPQTGWCEVYLVPNPRKPDLGVLIGDVMHNLRGALDYIITSLADASGANPDVKRGWPSYIKRAAYKGEVADRFGAKASGPLSGITIGLGVIEQLQPYRCQPDPRADPLALIQRFNNADKHRHVAALVSIPVGTLDIEFNGIPAEVRDIEEISNWSPDQKMIIRQIRFDPPRAYNFRVASPLHLDLRITLPKFRTEPEVALDLPLLEECCSQVRAVIDVFKLI